MQSETNGSASATTPSSANAELLAFAATLAREAGAIAAAQFGFSIARRKADGSLVTKTDEQIDRLLSQRIREIYPGDAILSEEQLTVYDPAIERTWVVDPLDGTTNFARGLPTWGVSIGLLVRGAPVVGVLYFPLLDELYAAAVGEGATCNGEAIRTTDEVVMDDEHIFMECTRTRAHYLLTLPLKSRMMGSAAFHMCKVADGSAMAGNEATPKVWDIAAAGLILTEAGGVMQGSKGDAVFPLPAERADYLSHSFPILYAGNAALLELASAGIEPYARPAYHAQE